MNAINWIIAFLGLIYVYVITFRNRKNSENFNLQTWVVENLDSLVASFIAVVTLMIIVSDKIVQAEIGGWLENKGMIFKVLFFKLLALTIGMTNTWLMDLIFRVGKRKLLKATQAKSD